MERLNLIDLRSQDKGETQRPPFPHQSDALAALRRTFTFVDGVGKGALLVFPTGGGKTFTAVKWLGDEVLPRNIKILWLAHSFHLLDQAYKEFRVYAKWILSRETLHIRVVSSSPAHDKVFSIDLDDDIVIMTTQTAIRSLHAMSEDATGRRVQTRFRKFLEACQTTGLIVILDEAHHAPAFGCRNLLIGDTEPRVGIRHILPGAHFLGLTATPTYTDPTRRGWLGEIFEQGVIYEARQPELMAQKILARPNFIEKPTGREFTVPDAIYNRIVREHADLPNEIVDRLASDATRNDYIVDEYVNHRDLYGKTIIFADRWFQCRYLMSKLEKRGVKADAVYSHIDADPGSSDAHNQRTETENARVLHEFKYGNSLDLLFNVRMLTEGTDIPSVKTVFITRQTTSSILMTQMIGRALRGKRAGGSDEANIVLFVDDWRRLIDWARPSLDGGKDQTQVVSGYKPLEFISVRLIDKLCEDINAGAVQTFTPFAKILPLGWFQTEFTVASAEENFDETQSVIEFVMVYEHTKPKFERFMRNVSRKLDEKWADEFLEPEWINPKIEDWIDLNFDRDTDNIGNTLDLDIARVVRHLAQNRGAVPVYHAFEDRERYDLDRLAKKYFGEPKGWESVLRNEFDAPGSLWKTFYRVFGNFRRAFLFAVEGILSGGEHDEATEVHVPPPRIDPPELSEAEKEQVILRDGRCLACGVEKGKARLQVDHIIPRVFGGPTTVENSQALCGVCNRAKKTDEMNFRVYSTRLQTPREPRLLPRNKDEDLRRSLTRLVNFFYRCQAVCRVHIHERSSGRHFAAWGVELYAGNNADWLLQYKSPLLDHIRTSFGCPHVEDITVTSPDFAGLPDHEPRKRGTGGRKHRDTASTSLEDESSISDAWGSQIIISSWDAGSILPSERGEDDGDDSE